MYYPSPHNFRLQTLPISSGGLSAFMKSERDGIQAGTLFFQEIAPILDKTPLVYAKREPFTLVNVYCSSSLLSYGWFDAPVEKNRPKACTWFFTFSMGGGNYPDKQTIRALRSINAVVWGTQVQRFLTIGIRHFVAQKLGLRYDRRTPRILYYLIGAMSKSFVRNHRYWNEGDFDYKALQPAMLKTQLLNTNLYALVGRTPAHLWVFSREAWRYGQTLLSPLHLTPNSLLYYFMYIPHQIVEKPLFEKAVALLQASSLDLAQGQKESYANVLFAALEHRLAIPEIRPLLFLQGVESSESHPVSRQRIEQLLRW